MGAQTGVKFSMLDAMAMGLPVLHVQDEANAGQVTEGINGYILHYGEELASIYPLIPKQQRVGPGQASGYHWTSAGNVSLPDGLQKW